MDYAQAQVDKRLSALADAKARIDEHMATERKQRLDKRAQLDSVPDDDDGDKAELADIERRVQEEREHQHQQLEKEAEATITVWRDAVSQVWIHAIRASIRGYTRCAPNFFACAQVETLYVAGV